MLVLDATHNEHYVWTAVRSRHFVKIETRQFLQGNVSNQGSSGTTFESDFIGGKF